MYFSQCLKYLHHRARGVPAYLCLRDMEKMRPLVADIGGTFDLLRLLLLADITKSCPPSDGCCVSRIGCIAPSSTDSLPPGDSGIGCIAPFSINSLSRGDLFRHVGRTARLILRSEVCKCAFCTYSVPSRRRIVRQKQATPTLTTRRLRNNISSLRSLGGLPGPIIASYAVHCRTVPTVDQAPISS
jgi:hypothetical protein